MNGVHDMGGLHGMGPVAYERNEPVFHAPWEGRVYALTRAMRAWRKWSLDADRYALERMPPVDYLRMSYYERWFHRLVVHVVQYGFVTNEEMESGKAAPGSTPASPAFSLATSTGWLTRGIPRAAMPAFDPRSRCGSASAPGTSIPRVTLASRGTRAGRPASSYGITASMFFQTPTRTRRARNVSTSTLFVSPHGSCGERAPHRATRFTSTCGMTTLSA